MKGTAGPCAAVADRSGHRVTERVEVDWLMDAPAAEPLPSLADLIPARPRWMARAACRGMDSAIFFPAQGHPTDEAREVCAGCPVREACLDYATGEGVEGVWAGTSKAERRGMGRKAS